MGIGYYRPEDKVFLRTYRYFFRLMSVGGTGTGAIQAIGESLVYMAARPRWTAKDEIINHQHEQITYPTRATWEPLDLTLLHVAGDSGMYNWLKRVQDPEEGTWGYYENMVADAEIEMVNGCGQTIERWHLAECWPLSIDWGELDRTSANISEIKVQLKYSRAKLMESQSVQSRTGGA